MEESHWYYVNPASKSQVGPLGLDDMKQLYREGKVTEDTFAWHEDAEEWGQLQVLQYQGQTLREICAESAPGSRKSTENYSNEQATKIASVQDSIEDRIRSNRIRTATESSSRLPSAIVPSQKPTNQDQDDPSSSSESSSRSGSVQFN